ncbi:phosphoglycolate phosphatase [Conexivisphaera calida]|uniref:phosphoglycolate phosphatase n=1 Tax=Conexivisphaera calida TaxID=1874277 RepID=UPI00157AF9CD|nr:phosphoglycolate phosphatase [Conexivisphaera calida]
MSVSPRLRLLAVDVDGTLTEERGSYRLSMNAISAIRELESRGISVILATGNSYQIASALTRYLGASWPAIAENGCVLVDRGNVESLCSGRPPDALVESIKALGLSEGWQNPCRLHDLEFVSEDRSSLARAVPYVERAMAEVGWKGRIIVSGYALHTQPLGGGKGAALRKVALRMSVGVQELGAVGDSSGDVDLLLAAGFRAAVGDADLELRKIADYVASANAGEGFAEVARYVMRRISNTFADQVRAVHDPIAAVAL